MSPSLLAAISALSISLIGSLPLGNLNITAMYIAAKKGIRAAGYFAFGVVLIEIMYLRISLVFVSWIIAHKNLFDILQWAVLLLLILLAINSFFAGEKKKENTSALEKTNPLLLGVFLSAVNPLQIPFWAGWAVYLITSKMLIAENLYYNVFSISAGIGTFLALFVFIICGARLSGYIKANTVRINFLMGMLFLILAVYQVWHLYTNA